MSYKIVVVFPIYYLDPCFSLPIILIVVTQIRGHIAGYPPPPSPLRFVPCIFNARRFQLFPRRLASNCAYPR